MTGSRDPCTLVHVHTDVALAGRDRLTGMDADAYSHRPIRERVPRVIGGGDRGRSSWESDEEGVALRVHLVAVVPGERVPE